MSLRSVTRNVTRSVTRSVISPIRRIFIDLQRSLPSSYLLDWTGTGAFEIEFEYSTTQANLQYLFDSVLGDNRFFVLIQADGAMQINTGITNVFIDDVEIDPLAVGAVPKDGKLHKMKLVGNTTTEIGKIGLRFNSVDGFDGVIANVKITDLATPSNSIPLIRLNQPTGNTEVAGSTTVTYSNIPTSNRELYTKQVNGDWLGVETAINGRFDTDTIWTKESPWVISGGTARIPTIATLTKKLSQPGSIKSGKRFQTIYDILDIAAGNFIISLGTGADGIVRTTTGNYREIIKSTGTSIELFNSSSILRVTIDNVSVKRILEAV